jgi:hypothetical protein
VSTPVLIQKSQDDTFFDIKISHCCLAVCLSAKLLIFPLQVKNKPHDEIANVHSDFWTTRPIGIPPRLLAP